MGFLVLGAAILYLLFSVLVVCLAIWFARKLGRSAKCWGWSAALAMFLIPFWDWLPTVVEHQYYCATQSGFWVYKTLEQWKEENPGVIETLMSYNKDPGVAPSFPAQQETRRDGHEKSIIHHMNRRFDKTTNWQDISKGLLIGRTEETLVDIGKNEVIARYVGFSSGYSVAMPRDPSDPWKAWLCSSDCLVGGREQRMEFGKFYLQFKGVEK